MLQRLLRCLLRGAAVGALFVVAGGHQDGVVHRCAQLDGADDDAGDEGQLGAGEVRDAHVDGDGGFNAGDQQHRNGQAAEGDQDDDGNGHDGPDVDILEVHIRDLDQVFGHGTLAGHDAFGVHRLDGGVHLIHLGVDGVGAGLIGAVGKDQLVPAGLQDLGHAVGQQTGIEAGAGDGIEADHLRDAVDVLEFVAQVRDLGGTQVVVNEDEVGGGHAKVLAQLVGADNAGQVLGQGVEQGVVDFCLVLRNGKGDQQHKEDGHDGRCVLRDEVAQLGEPGNDGAVLVLLDPLIKGENQRGQDDDGADDAQRHALCHDKADIAAQRQAHGAQGKEARDGGQGGSGDGGHGLADGADHGFLIGGAELFFLLIAVEQEDGEVHRDTQLQHRGKGLGDVTDLTKEDVGAEVVHDGEQKAQHEQQRRDGAFQREEEHQQACTYSAEDVQRHFLIDQGLGVLQNDAHAAEEAVLPEHLLDLPNGVHRLIAGAGAVEPDDEHGGIIFAEHELLDVRREHFLRHAGVQHIAQPERLGDAGNGLDVLFHGDELVGGEALDRDHTGRSQMEVVLKDLLADHGVQLLRQIGEDVIVDAGGNGADGGRDQQQDRYC